MNARIRRGARAVSWRALATAPLVAVLIASGHGHAAETTTTAAASLPEPIAFIGHGAMFDHLGREVSPSIAFLSRAQDWYRSKLLADVKATDRQQFGLIERELSAGLALDPQARLVMNAHLIDWLAERAQTGLTPAMRGKLKLIRSHLRFQLDGPAATGPVQLREAYAAPVALQTRLLTNRMLNLKLPQVQPQLVTGNTGAAYRTECTNHGVPLPPNFNSGQWVSQGTIAPNDLFIVRGLSAEALTYTSAAPAGLCVALPRFSGNTVALDGIICMGQADPMGGRPKVCFWDNQQNDMSFSFPKNNPPAITQWAGGAELVDGQGGPCTNCHAGENPYIVHGPVLSALGPNASAPDWHDPIVGAGTGWAQNPGPMNSPPSCTLCHGSASSTNSVGRLPHLSNALGGYCNAVLRPSLGAGLVPTLAMFNGDMAAFTAERNRPRPPASMPLTSPGGVACTPNLMPGDTWYVPCNAGMTASCSPGIAAGASDYIACTPEISALLGWCGQPPANDASSRGDPHIVTFDGTPYDFQGAGEFVYLRNGSNVEIQVRQTPVATAAPVGPDGHTGLTTCPSINTAVAARMGKSRISYQPAPKVSAEPSSMELHIDGKLVRLPSGSIKVGDGLITRATIGSGLEIDFGDGTHLSVVQDYWPTNKVWYLNVDVTNAKSREGIAGAILDGQWLPLLPDGSPLGPRPASLAQRHFDLNKTFANAWRVTSASSLFDYATGTSTGTFTDLNWPPEKPPCTIKGSDIPPAKPVDIEVARRYCLKVEEKDLNEQCVFDVAGTGNTGFVNAYLTTQELRKKNAAQKKSGVQAAAR